MKRSHLKIIDEFYNPITETSLVLAFNKCAKARGASRKSRSYLVGLSHRSKEKDVDECTYFPSLKKARHYFHDVANEDFAHKKISKDFQQDALYKWEDEFVVPYCRPIKSKKQAEKIVAHVCAEEGLSTPPTLVWKKECNSSWYMRESNEILFGHRDEGSLLHELAHALIDNTGTDDRGVHDCEYDHHGAGFAWKAIELYTRYAGFNTHYLVSSAQARNLLGPLDQNMCLFPTKNAAP